MGLILNTNVGRGGYQIPRSLRFRSGASAYFARTPSGAGHRTIWTASFWVKRGSLGSAQMVLSSGTDAFNNSSIYFDTSDRLNITNYIASSYVTNKVTNRVFRDPSSWMHIVVASNGSTSLKVYVNGVEETSFGTNTVGSSNWFYNATNAHNIGRYKDGASQYCDVNLAQVEWVDGYALAASDFGQFDLVTGVWNPIPFSGLYGTNGFKLDFSDNSAATSGAIGADSSGNGNNWTPNNFSVTAGVTNDSLVDTPTNYGSDTGIGGEVRGNYAVLSPLDKRTDLALTNANLTAAGGTANASVASTMAFTSGKWIFSARIDSGSGGTPGVGVCSVDALLAATSFYPGQNATSWGIFTTSSVNGQVFTNGAGGSSLFTFAIGDEAVVAIDSDAGKGWFGRYASGVLTWATVGGVGNPATGTNPTFTFTPGMAMKAAVRVDGATVTANFGQRPWGFTAPLGFKALCTQNLPDPLIKKPSEYMDIVGWAGNDTSGRNITGLNFQPDFVWTKNRSAANSNILTDSARGANKQIYSDSGSVEASSTEMVKAFNSNGFQIGYDTSAVINKSGNTYVAWCLKESPAFKRILFTGTGAAQNIAHSLGVAPELIIYKNRTGSTAHWAVGLPFLNGGSSPWGYYLSMNLTAAQASSTSPWNSTAPTSSVFTVGVNATAGVDFVGYVFTSVPGFCKVGTYTGTGSATGPFIYCGFRPRFVLGKDINGTNNWFVFDSYRDPSNGAQYLLRPNLSDVELSGTIRIDLTSNGFVPRTVAGLPNDSSSTNYIFVAFAEAPFKYARAR